MNQSKIAGSPAEDSNLAKGSTYQGEIDNALKLARKMCAEHKIDLENQYRGYERRNGVQLRSKVGPTVEKDRWLYYWQFLWLGRFPSPAARGDLLLENLCWNQQSFVLACSIDVLHKSSFNVLSIKE